MNLAQLIDPEWARADFPPRVVRARPPAAESPTRLAELPRKDVVAEEMLPGGELAPAAPAQIRKRKPSPERLKVLRAVAELTSDRIGGVLLREIWPHTGMSAHDVSMMLWNTRAAGLLQTSGARMTARYSLTPSGMACLAEHGQ